MTSVIQLQTLPAFKKRLLTIEKMIAGMVVIKQREENYKNDPCINTLNFGKCWSTRNCQNKAEHFLVAPIQENYSTYDEVIERLSENGYEPSELPQLARLKLKNKADDIWWGYPEDNIYGVFSLGPNSIWPAHQDNNYNESIVYFRLDPQDRGFKLHQLKNDFLPDNWFLVHKKCN